MSLPLVARWAGAVLLLALAVAYFTIHPVNRSGAPFADFSAYYAAGKVWLQHGNPFGFAIWQAERQLPGMGGLPVAILPYVGPPAGLPLWGVLALLPYDVAAGVWAGACTLCGVVILLVPALVAGRRIERRDGYALALLFASFAPLVTAVAVGQAALPATAAIDLAILAAARRRWTWAAGAAFAAALFKPNLALVLVATVRSLGAVIAYAASALATALATALTGGGWGALAAYLSVVVQQSAAERFYLYQFTPAAIAFGFGLPQGAAILLGVVVSLLACGATAAAIRRSRASVADGAAIACAGYPFVVPFVHQADLIVVLLPGLVAIYRAQGAAWLLAAAGLVLVSIDSLAFSQGEVAAVFTPVIAVVAALQIAALNRTVSWRLRVAPLAIVPALLVLALFAPAQRLPLWPGSLSPAFTASASESPTHVWQRELDTLALEVPSSYIALLRCISLAGCIAIGVAMTGVAAQRRKAAEGSPPTPSSTGSPNEREHLTAGPVT